MDTESPEFSHTRRYVLDDGTVVEVNVPAGESAPFEPAAPHPWEQPE